MPEPGDLRKSGAANTRRMNIVPPPGLGDQRSQTVLHFLKGPIQLHLVRQ